LNKCALLVVDVQTALIKRQPYNVDKVIDNIKELISIARDNEIEVIYISHDVKIDKQLDRGPMTGKYIRTLLLLKVK